MHQPHIFFLCPYARAIWAASEVWYLNAPAPQDSFYANLANCLWGKNHHELHISWPWILWRIWKARNEYLFEGKSLSPHDAVVLASEGALEWTHLNVDNKIPSHMLEKAPSLPSLSHPPAQSSIRGPQERIRRWSSPPSGTMGYVAPEYALYGQLTEKSDVYSFGVVLLELLSRRKAIVTDEDGQPVSVADWAWSLVREGQTLDVVEDGMPEKGSPEVLEKYVLIAVLCSHPQLHARPTMDQVVKMLESNEFTVISIPQRPIPLVACRDEIDRSVSSSSGSGKLTSPTGYQAFSFGADGSHHK